MGLLRITSVCLLLSFLYLSSLFAEKDKKGETEFRVSVFDVDATPPVGSWLAYDRMEGCWSLGLRARGMIFFGMEKPVVICTVDWIGIANEGQDAFKEALAESAGTDTKHVAVHTLHQHDAPICDFSAEKILWKAGLVPASFDGSFARIVIERLKEAVKEAKAVSVPITHIGTGTGIVEKVASNRRIDKVNGKQGAMRGSSCKDISLRSKPEGLIDPDVSVISLWNGNQPVVVLSYYAVHPQSYYLTKTANPDFPGVARFYRELEVPDALHLHFNGAGGDVSAGKYNDGSHIYRKLLADRLAEGMRKAWEVSVADTVPLKEAGWKSEPLALPVADGVKEMVEQKMCSADMRFLTNNISKLAWIYGREAGKMINVACMAIGPARILFLPGELFVSYQLKAKNMRKDLFVALAAYGDYGPFYIGTEEAYAEGGYEIESSPVTGDAEKEILQVVERLLNK